jgi:hypothetical protein
VYDHHSYHPAFRLIVLGDQDALRDMEADERLEKLQETYKGVEEDYHRILELI